MASFFIWTLLKVIVLMVSGYYIYNAINKSKADKQDEKIEREFKQVLIKNAYENFQADIEIANKISGLKIHKQKYIPNIKPVFYFKLDNKTTKDEIRSFLASLPDNFLVAIPALKISIEDSKAKNIYFWKSDCQFQLTYHQDNCHVLLGKIRQEELVEKIYNESATYSLQNINVERIKFA